jgi:hypothetical protein
MLEKDIKIDLIKKDLKPSEVYKALGLCLCTLVFETNYLAHIGIEPRGLEVQTTFCIVST